MRYRSFGWSFFWLFAAACCACTLVLSGMYNAQPTVETITGPQMPSSTVLSGLVVAIDAGHGGYDGGAVGRKSRVMEKELNLDVAFRLRDALKSQGAQIIMTRDGDYALCEEDPPIRKKLQDMQRRAALVLEGKADILLSIHMNEYTNSRQSGPQVFYRDHCPAGQALADAIQATMNQGLKPSRERASHAGDYYVLTLGVPSVLVECGFLSNAQEEALLREGEYRARVAQSICEGVMAWAVLPEHPEPLPAQAR